MKIFLLCCGPSIKYQNLQCLQGELCVSVSNFFIHPLITNINPKYHIFPPIHSPISNEMAIGWFKEADSYLPKDTIIFLNHIDLHFWNNFQHSRKIQTYNSGSILYQSVSQIALYLIINMNPTEIYLLGCDHNWLRHVGQTRHFYNNSESILQRMGYDEWFGQNKQEAQQREKQCNDNLFRIYEQYRSLAESKNISIYNTTPGSRLKVFNTTTLFDIFEEPTMEKI